MKTISILGLLCALLSLPCGKALADDTTTLSVGADYSSGDYGDSTKTDTWFFPISGKYESDRLTLKLTVPYVRMTGPGNVIGVGGDRVSVSGAGGERATESGLGDVTASAGYAIVQNSGWLVEIIGKVKAPTADEDKGLGTGETDYSAQVDLARVLDKTTVFGTLGQKFFGDPEGFDFRDPVYASIGVSQKLTNASAGIAYDWREKATPTGDEISEATVFYVFRLSPVWRTQIYLVKGFSDASPDWGAGIVQSYRF